MKKTVLCVEDEIAILENNKKALLDEGYSVLTAETLAEAREMMKKHSPDAIVLDIMLPDGLGLDFLKELRDRGNKTPILLLTAWSKPSDIAYGLRAGANDYLSKPFYYEVMLARVEAMIRNAEQIPERITHHLLEIDVLSSQAYLDGVNMLLTQKEIALLQFFIQHEGRIVSAEFIYEKIWSQPMNNDASTLKSHISNLRKKLASSGYTITSVRNQGYCFEKDG